VVRFPVTATSPAATSRSDAVSTTLPSLTLRPVAFSEPMPPGPVSSSGKVAIVNVEPVLLVSKGLISKLSKPFAGLMLTNFVPGTDARVI